MKVGDYVLYGDIVWRVWVKHSSGSYQIKNLTPRINYIDNQEVMPEDVEVITKEVADVIRSSYEDVYEYR